MNIKVAPSLLSADFLHLGDEINSLVAAGADMLHIDVMDGHFVPDISMGPIVLRSLENKIPLDIHLMIEKPEHLIDSFMEYGDVLTVHVESSSLIGEVIRRVKNSGKKIGLAIKPSTELSAIKPYLDNIDMVLVMSVEPGAGGRKFLENVLPKIRSLRKIYSGDIGVDGGINAETSAAVIKAGANVLVSGSYIFGNDYADAIKKLRGFV
ncbi:MAG: ribulose-phosphate 3-epimerase [Candidatus Aenigmarchaeota archaeon]|nr:ribulose-phosphate 3-epimerase [Candidatus Aenigmarchaeota archaeon]